MSNRRKSKHPRKPPTRGRARAGRRMRAHPSQRRQPTPSPQGILAGTLGICMAQKAVEIMARYRDRLTIRPNANGTIDFDWDFPAPDGAVLVTILEAANDCWGFFDERAPEERIWSTILQLIELDDTVTRLADAAAARLPEP